MAATTATPATTTKVVAACDTCGHENRECIRAARVPAGQAVRHVCLPCLEYGKRRALICNYTTPCVMCDTKAYHTVLKRALRGHAAAQYGTEACVCEECWRKYWSENRPAQ